MKRRRKISISLTKKNEFFLVEIILKGLTSEETNFFSKYVQQSLLNAFELTKITKGDTNLIA